MTPSTFTYEDIVRRTRGERGAIRRSDLCISCLRSRKVHGENGRCPLPFAFNSSFKTRNLADGLMCADCVNLRRCVMIFGQLPEDQQCQWFPIRFEPRFEPKIQGAATPVRHETQPSSVQSENSVQSNQGAIMSTSPQTSSIIVGANPNANSANMFSLDVITQANIALLKTEYTAENKRAVQQYQDDLATYQRNLDFVTAVNGSQMRQGQPPLPLPQKPQPPMLKVLNEAYIQALEQSYSSFTEAGYLNPDNYYTLVPYPEPPAAVTPTHPKVVITGPDDALPGYYLAQPETDGQWIPPGAMSDPQPNLGGHIFRKVIIFHGPFGDTTRWVIAG